MRFYKSFISAIVAALVLCFCGTAFCGAIAPKKEEGLNKTIVFFSNGGILNSDPEVYNSYRKLQDLVKSSNLSAENEVVHFAVSRNYKEFLPLDLMKSYVQNPNKSKAETLKAFFAILQSEKDAQLKADMRKELQKYFAEEIKDDDKDLQCMIEEYTALLKLGYRVIIVAHSQGNLYANKAYKHIVKENPEYAKSICVIGVGSPDVNNHENMPLPETFKADDLYTAAKDDLVLGALGNKVSANVSFGESSSALNHSFADSYMVNKESVEHITKGLTLAFKHLEFPKATSKTRFISSTIYAVDIFFKKVFYKDNYLKIYALQKGVKPQVMDTDKNPQYDRFTCMLMILPNQEVSFLSKICNPSYVTKRGSIEIDTADGQTQKKKYDMRPRKCIDVSQVTFTPIGNSGSFRVTNELLK